ncbi:unnamed protein product, partial [Symbiodinium necroappetens]
DSSVKSRPRLESTTSVAATSQASEASTPKDVPPAEPGAPASLDSVVEGKGPEKKERNDETRLSDDECETPEEKKLYARMEAKIRRMCTPSPTTGKTTASPTLMKEWKDKGYTRTQLVKIMIEADGDKDPQKEEQAVFQSKLETWRKTEQFRNVATKGAWFSEPDMKKPVSEGGLAFTTKKVQKVKDFCERHGFVRKNQYDDDELEYWVDFRTEGSRGTNESDGVLEKKQADTTGTGGFAMGALGDGPMPDLPINGDGAAGVAKDSGKACCCFGAS